MGDRNSVVCTDADAYPDRFGTAEAEVLATRRAAVGLPEDAAQLGVGVSGGGIRSATFALGFFQTLSEHDCTKQIDYLSTVSGGGYFGGFLGALFRRPGIRSHSDVQRVLAPENRADVIRYLRENGSYLAPAGTDSLLLAAATLFRNWCVIQLLFLAVLFGAFLLLQVGTKLLELNAPLTAAAAVLPIWRVAVPPSPWLAAALAASVLWVAPLTWSYWVIGRDVPAFLPPTVRAIAKVLWTALFYLVVAAAGVALALEAPAYTEAGLLMAGVAGFALGIGLMAMIGRADWAPGFAAFGAVAAVVVCACNLEASVWWVTGTCSLAVGLVAVMLIRELKRDWSPAAGMNAPAQASDGAEELDDDNEGRYELSAALKTALVVTGGVLALAIVDTAARYIVDSGWNLVQQSIGFGAIITLGSSVLRRAWALFAQPPGRRERPSLPTTLLAGIAAILTVLVILLACDAAAYLAVRELSAGLVARAANAEALRAFVVHSGIALGAVLLLNLLLGSSRNLLNASTQLPLYSARIIRAYLGASNPKRIPYERAPVPAPVPARRSEAPPSANLPANDTRPKGESDPSSLSLTRANRSRSVEIGAGKPSAEAATRVMPGDDIPASAYFWWDNGARDARFADPYAKGAPLHFVNVTINETVDGRSQIQQGDRKGVGLAVGPCGFSVGVRHHAVFFKAERHTFPERGWKVFRFASDDPTGEAAVSGIRSWVRAFGPTHWFNRQNVLANFPFDQLSFGQWLGISGAAFSTGLGSRTNLGLSVLAALANVRLGFWWRPGIRTSVSWLHKFGALFWVQTYLFRELLARFPGTSRALWYLSDGGHFENLGGYELIRRRLPYVMILDAEQDASYQCESLANLVRKARLDFGAEIEFLERPADAFADGAHWGGYTGSLNELQRGEWFQDGSGAWRLTAATQHGASRAYAALGRIRYTDHTFGWLLYIKPTLLGDETQDLRNYHASHPAFPHEPTTDQFFDEAQWESYRFLGQTIADRLWKHDGVLRLFFERKLPDAKDARVPSSRSQPVPRTG